MQLSDMCSCTYLPSNERRATLFVWGALNSTFVQTKECAAGSVLVGGGSKRSMDELEEEHDVRDTFVVNWEECRAIPKKHGAELVTAYAAPGICVCLFRKNDV